jgi:hypothetical protein
MTISMIPRERCEFSAIIDRPPLRLPGEARLAFSTIVNYEVWDFSAATKGVGRPAPQVTRLTPGPQGGLPQSVGRGARDAGDGHAASGVLHDLFRFVPARDPRSISIPASAR